MATATLEYQARPHFFKFSMSAPWCNQADTERRATIPRKVMQEDISANIIISTGNNVEVRDENDLAFHTMWWRKRPKRDSKSNNMLKPDQYLGKMLLTWFTWVDSLFQVYSPCSDESWPLWSDVSRCVETGCSKTLNIRPTKTYSQTKRRLRWLDGWTLYST